MSGSKLASAFVIAALFLGLNAPAADAAVFAHRSAGGFRVAPGPGVGGGFRRSSTTAVRGTPFRPAVGPQVYHRSRTAFVR